MATNQISPFCPTDTGTNLLTQVAYAAASDRTNGNQPGVASSKLNNKALRQSAFIASQFAQYIANQTGIDVLDDGNTSALLATIGAAFANPIWSSEALNLGLSCTVSANALTINVKTAAGATPSAVDPVSIGFRDSSASTGNFSVQKITGALSIVVPSSATLGQISAMDQYVWVYAIYDGSSIQLGVSGVNVFDDLSLQSSTTISSGATSGTILYSTTGVSSKRIRLIGRLLVNETTAGTWATAPTEVALMPTPKLSVLDWTAYTPSFLSFGITSAVRFQYSRKGQDMYVQGKWTNGTNTNVTSSISLPNSLKMNNSLLTLDLIGQGAQTGTNSTFHVTSDTATDQNLLYFSTIGGSYQTKMSGVGFDSNATNVIQVGPLPMVGWSAYGP